MRNGWRFSLVSSNGRGLLALSLSRLVLVAIGATAGIVLVASSSVRSSSLLATRMFFSLISLFRLASSLAFVASIPNLLLTN